MSEARSEILARIRAARITAPPQAPPVAPPQAPLSVSPQAPPGAPAPVGLVGLFCERVAHYDATVRRVATDSVAENLGSLIVAGSKVVAPRGFPQQWTAGLNALVVDGEELTKRDLDGFATVLSTCAVAVAETGTVILDGGVGQGRRALSLLPDHHVVVVKESQIVAGVDDAVGKLDPRKPLTWISGPSATADIELVRVRGVHGPRRLDVVVVGA